MNPSEHVSDVSDWIVRVQLDRSGETGGTTPSQGVEEEVEDGGGSSSTENGEDITDFKEPG